MNTDFPIVYAQTKITSAEYSYTTITIPAGSYTYFPSDAGVMSLRFRVKTYTIKNKGGGDVNISLEYCNDFNYHGVDPDLFEWVTYYPRDADYVVLPAGQSITWSFRENLWYTRMKIENASSTDADLVVSRVFG